jgi:hypothetical protein
MRPPIVEAAEGLQNDKILRIRKAPGTAILLVAARKTADIRRTGGAEATGMLLKIFAHL